MSKRARLKSSLWKAPGRSGQLFARVTGDGLRYTPLFLMREKPAISVVHLRQLFPTRRGRLPDLLGPLKRPIPQFAALDDVCLSVAAGQTVGIVGGDGAGKTTLLRVISGGLRPTSGEVKTTGRTCSVIATRSAQAGPRPALSHIQRTASRLGLRKRQIREKLPEIAAFAGLADLKRPLESDLSPSWIRLAFSLAVGLDPDVLLLDDCLAFTDPLFRCKCLDLLTRIKSTGVTILLVSQDMDVIRSLCERVILLENGRIVADGSAHDVTEKYEQDMSERSGGLIHTPVPAFSKTYRRRGTGTAKIKEIRLEDNEGKPVVRLLTGLRYRFRLGIAVLTRVDDLTARIMLCDQFGNEVFGTNTRNHGLAFGALAAGQSTEVIFELDAFLAPGDYFISAALYAGASDRNGSFDRIDNALHFEVLPRGPQRTGTIWLPARARIILK